MHGQVGEQSVAVPWFSPLELVGGATDRHDRIRQTEQIDEGLVPRDEPPPVEGRKAVTDTGDDLLEDDFGKLGPAIGDEEKPCCADCNRRDTGHDADLAERDGEGDHDEKAGAQQAKNGGDGR